MITRFAAITALTMFFVLKTPGEVMITRLIPPIFIDAFSTSVLGTDFNHDGEPDFRLVSEVGMFAYFDAPTQVAARNGEVAAVPFGTMIGSNIVSRTNLNIVWSPGVTNSNSSTQALGDHTLLAISGVIPQLVVPGQPPHANGNIAGKEGVIAVQFYVDGLPHYGYLQFDFRSKRSGSSVLANAAGLIYGWAYETTPGLPIKAKRIAYGPPAASVKAPNGR